MNGQPHTHRVEIYRNGFGDNNWWVRYGDTKVKLATRFADPFLWPKDKWDRKVGKAVAKAIREHDEGSLEAEQREQNKQARLSQLQPTTTNQWGSETLR